MDIYPPVQQALERLLRHRFGPVSEATRTRLQTATPEQLGLGRAPARRAQ
ncbi:MAG: hypothetical protein WBJ41_00880 [Chromatiaceae bacterium]